MSLRAAPVAALPARLLAKARQSFNLEGLRLTARVALGGQQSLALPHLSPADITHLDWHALRAAGFRGVVFDKARAPHVRRLRSTHAATQDNTLTVPYAPHLHRPLQVSLEECLAAFSGAACILSNSAGLFQYDPDGHEAEALEATLGLHVLRHGAKKPGGTADALEKHFGCAAHELVMVGDRYLTDVLFGNRLGMLTARPQPLQPGADGLVVRGARRVEDALVRRWTRGGSGPPPHSLLPAGEEAQRRACAGFVKAQV